MSILRGNAVFLPKEETTCQTVFLNIPVLLIGKLFFEVDTGVPGICHCFFMNKG